MYVAYHRRHDKFTDFFSHGKFFDSKGLLPFILYHSQFRSFEAFDEPAG